MASDRHRLLARGEQQRVREGAEVEEVVRVHVGDADRVDVDVVVVLAQLRERAVAAIDDERRLALGDQVAAAGASGILPSRGLAEHCQLHRVTGVRQGPRPSSAALYSRKARKPRFRHPAKIAAYCVNGSSAPPETVRWSRRSPIEHDLRKGLGT
jgi:hypothetical protein